MSHGILVQLAGIFILGVCSQWAAWRFRIPSILLLLAAGFAVGPGLGLVHPDKLFGELLLPMVSLAVAVILYEGGLNLRWRELRKLQIRGVLLRLVTISVVISWLLGAAAAHYILGFPWSEAALLGAILVVTGPTVIGPMLKHLRLRGRVGSLLKWEGIVVDPMGAILAVLVFTVVRTTELREGLVTAAINFGITILVGIAFGCLAAFVLVLALRRFWIPDPLHNPVSLMLMFATFVSANALQDEAGLFAVTMMGVALANQKWVSLRHVVEFKETLAVLLISMLFVTLAARLQVKELQGLGIESLVFVIAMILVVRPLSILVATIGTPLTWAERIFLSWMAPRGIVAAAVSSVFALELVAAGYPRGVELVPVTFLIVFVTVLVYGLTSGPLARYLGLVQLNPQGVLFVGAQDWVREIAGALTKERCPVLLVDTDWDNISKCRMSGLNCLYGSALAEHTREQIDFGGLGRMLAVTSNNEVNALACVRYLEDFGRKEVYQLPFAGDKQRNRDVIPQEHQGRLLFSKESNFSVLSDAFGEPPRIRVTKLSKEFDFKAFKAENENSMLLLFVVKSDGTIQVCTVEEQVHPVAGDSIVWGQIQVSQPAPVSALA